MSGAHAVLRFELRLAIRTTPQRLWAVLTDPRNIPRLAAGIEGAEVVAPGRDGVVGMELELVTKNARLLRATVVEARPGRLLAVEDERGVRATWIVEPAGAGRVTLLHRIEGPIAPDRMAALRYDADVKAQALLRLLETDA